MASIVVVAILIITLLVKYKSYFTSEIDKIKDNVNDIVGITNDVNVNPTPDPPKDPEYITKQSELSKVDFEEFNAFLHYTATSEAWEASIDLSENVKERIKNLKNLYNRDKNNTQYTPVMLSEVNASDKIEYKLKSCFFTDNENDINIPDGIIYGLHSDPIGCNDTGELIDGFKYLVLDVEITNKDDKDIGLFLSYAQALKIHFYDTDGELYWEDTEDYVSFQPGDTEKTVHYYYGFKAGETLSVRYVFTIPTAAFQWYDCCIVFEPLGDITYPLDTTRLIVLDELNQNIRKDNNDEK